MGYFLNPFTAFLNDTIKNKTVFPIFEETLTVSNTTTTSLTKNANFISCILSVEDYPIRMFSSGVNPTQNEGHLIQSGGVINLNSNSEITSFKAIGIGGNAKIQVSYYGTEMEIDNTPPLPPLGVSVTAGNSELNIAWNHNTESDLKGYNVYINGTKHNSVPITTNSYSAAPLTNGTSYAVQVTSVDFSNNESAKSTEVFATPLMIISDTFNRANSSIIGTTETGGKTWSQFNGTWQIVSNSLKLTAHGTANASDHIGFSTDSVNGIFKTRFLTNEYESRIGFRLTDNNPYFGYLLINKGGTYKLFTTNGGTSEIGTRLASLSARPGDVVEVRMNNLLIDIYINDIHIITHTIGDNYHVAPSAGTTIALGGVSSSVGVSYDDVYFTPTL